MTIEAYVRAMPKVELHVHLEGSIRPETLLALAQRNRIPLPAETVEGLRAWYSFTDFPHFVKTYLTVTGCIRTPDDLELITREFLAGQAEQNVRHSEVTYTALTVQRRCGIGFPDQLAAINRARAWAEQELGVTMTLTMDIAREVPAEDGLIVADWAISAMGNGVSAFGLGGDEPGNPPEKFTAAFNRARAAGLPSVPHAGETAGPASIWGALRALGAERIGHGVRCLEDPALVAELRDRQVPLEVCPTSNVCLKVARSLAEHPLPRLLNEGLYVTLNSDDPPMFNTTLNEEYLAAAQVFGLGPGDLEQLSLNALRASFLPPARKQALEAEFKCEFARLREARL
jgi:adenosine deaminase